jgi:hypothetical protein
MSTWIYALILDNCNYHYDLNQSAKLGKYGIHLFCVHGIWAFMLLGTYTYTIVSRTYYKHRFWELLPRKEIVIFTNTTPTTTTCTDGTFNE